MTGNLEDRSAVVSVRGLVGVKVVGPSVPHKHEEGAASNASSVVTKRLFTVFVGLVTVAHDSQHLP